MATTDTPTGTSPDAFRDAIDAIVGTDILVDLDRVARMLNLPGREAVRYRMLRGTLPLRTVRPGGRTAEILVPTSDVYDLLGLTWTPPAAATEVLARVMPDGSVHLATSTD